MSLFKFLRIIFFLLFLSSCGGSDASGREEKPINTVSNTMRLLKSSLSINGVVTGLGYKTSNGFVGVTDEKGSFRHSKNQEVCFYLGELFLGCAYPVDKPSYLSDLSTTKIISPLNLMRNGKKFNQEQVNNLVRLLMSLDSDQNPKNGIELDARIDASLKIESLSFDNPFNPELVLTAVNTLTGGNYQLVTASEGESYLCLLRKEENCGVDISTNSAPIADAIGSEVDENGVIQIALVASDAEGDYLTYLKVTNPMHGRLSLNGVIATYTPDENYTGDDSFSYKVNDGKLDSAIARVSITVNPLVAACDAVFSATIKTDEEYKESICTALSNPHWEIIAPEADKRVGMMMNSLTGELSWIPSIDQQGQLEVKIEISNDISSEIKTLNLIIEQGETEIDPIFNTFHVGFGGSSSFPFVSAANSNDKIWVSAKSLVLDENMINNSYYAGIKNFDAAAFLRLQQSLKKSKFIILWFTEDWQESWFNVDSIQALMDAGYIPVFNYWYFGDKLIAGKPDEAKKLAYKEDNIRVANFLAKLNGKKMLIMEPEFNKKPVIETEASQHEFAALISSAITTIKEKNAELLVSLSMMDTGSRGVNNTEAKCGYANCALGDVYAWQQPEIVFNDLKDQLDFVSFHQMMAQFSRDYTNPGDWDHPNPRTWSDEALGIAFLADRIANFAKYLNEKYQKPVFMPYIGIMTATWDDANNNDQIENEEIDYNGWEDRATAVYKKLAELKPTLKANGLFGFAPMALFDNPRHDYGGYQYFINNEYHLGIIGSTATDETDVAPYGDLYFKKDLLEYIFDTE